MASCSCASVLGLSHTIREGHLEADGLSLLLYITLLPLIMRQHQATIRVLTHLSDDLHHF